ncbi:hypothetical protein C9374_005068 [Naegleria lovaniensis]|uniref:FZ domain-containing protein n=1 Tax=Naegleria lovaniensis TaxID=51637 RepID=A0AA88KK25_NAELO|nr:uncharacterized protein C9374_005068 [Naegleria lovaniensis]KAG2382488.1 hypothetical protein C9374_005068 [Naegleria lovaniensis]
MASEPDNRHHMKTTNPSSHPHFRISFILVLLYCSIILLFSTGQLDSQEGNYYNSECYGECISLSQFTNQSSSSMTNHNDQQVETSLIFFNESIAFCAETLLEYMSLNASIRICISSNFTVADTLNSTVVSQIHTTTSNTPHNFTLKEKFYLNDHQARLSFYNTQYQQGLFQRDQCYNAARRYICQHYFPLCDATRDDSNKIYNLCMSSCENYYTSCNSKELIEFRCLASNNEIQRPYRGVWKNFGDDLKLLCTGGASIRIQPYMFITFWMGILVLWFMEGMPS